MIFRYLYQVLTHKIFGNCHKIDFLNLNLEEISKVSLSELECLLFVYLDWVVDVLSSVRPESPRPIHSKIDQAYCTKFLLVGGLQFFWLFHPPHKTRLSLQKTLKVANVSTEIYLDWCQGFFHCPNISLPTNRLKNLFKVLSATISRFPSIVSNPTKKP